MPPALMIHLPANAQAGKQQVKVMAEALGALLSMWENHEVLVS